MSYIAGLRLQNFMRYRGLTELELEPKPYAITAEWEGDPDRSNWGGKSTLTWAIRFALTGQHPKRTEDEWITDGEKEGGVDLELNDGTFISRTRIRGKSTQLRVVYQTPTVVSGVPDGKLIGNEEREAHGADAEEVLARLLGFTDKDAAATWWVGQGSMSRLLTMQPAELSEIVNGWLELGPLEAAYEHTLYKLRELDREKTAIQARLSVLRETFRVESNRPVDVGGAIKERVAQLEHLLASAGGNEAVARWQEWDRDRQAHDRLEQLKVERSSKTGVRVFAPDPKLVTAEAQKNAELRSDIGIAQSELNSKRRLMTGGFDGVCPVGGIHCPVTEQLNSATIANQKLLTAAEAAHRSAEKAWENQNEVLRKLNEQVRIVERLDRDIADLDRRIAQEAPAAARYLAANNPVDPATAQAIVVELHDARNALRRHEEVLARAESEAAQIAMYEARLAELTPLVQARREALQILGRNGAPRRIAESALGQIQNDANAAMIRCGIDLQVTVEWAREGKKLSNVCYSCGASLGTQQKLKTCHECNAERGPQLEERLAIKSSADSGGGLDLAGAMLQPAIAHWLRQRRGYSWGVIVLDEPLGQLDKYNRTAFANKLAGALRTEFAAEQCFLVSHETSSLDAMPGRIRVIAGPNGSRAVVE